MKDFPYLPVFLGVASLTIMWACHAGDTVKVIPPIYVPMASFYKDGNFLHAEVVSDDVFTTLHECTEKTAAAVMRVMQSDSLPEGAGLKIACVPVPSMLANPT